MAPPKVLVTGATGYTGAHCVLVLLRQGYRVKGTVRSLKNADKVKFLRELCPEADNKLELVEADLSNEGPWADIVKDCDYVLHVASPVNINPTATEEEVVKPAVEGVLMVLRACSRSKRVKRVVFTSSNTAVNGAFRYRKEPFTEKDWGDPNEPMPFLYIKGKILAERAAWEFIEKLPDAEKMELAVIHPTCIMGPGLSPILPEAGYLLKAILEGGPPMKHALGMTDVRDLAVAHVNAMHVPTAVGKRHILVGDHLWFKEVAAILKEEFEPQGYKITTKENTENQPLPVQENKPIYNGSYARKTLGVIPRPIKETILDMAYAAIETGHVAKKPGYKGPKWSKYA